VCSSDLIEVPYAPGATEVVAEFKFVNEGQVLVPIQTVATSCGCLTASTDQGVYAASESGVLTAVLAVEKLSGLQQQRIVVEAGGSKHVLTVKVSLPDWILVSEKRVMWPIGALASTKTIQISAPKGTSLKVLTAKSSNALFKSELRAVQEASQYELLVTPVTTKFGYFGVVQLDVELPGGIHRELRVSMRVEQPTRN